MRSESANYKTIRQQWVTKPSIIVRPSFVRKAGDLTDYPFQRDFSMFDVISPTKPKLKVIKDVRGQTQDVDPVSGRSTVGALEVDLGDINRDVLKQISDPGRPLRLPIMGSCGVRLSSHIRALPMARTLNGSTWTQSGLASFTAARVNDDDTETNIAFDADAAAAGSTLQLDLGSGNSKAFIAVAVFSAGTGANATWAIEESDDGSTWTTLATGFSTGAHKVDRMNFPYSGAHRYWRLRKTNAATGGPDYYEVHFDTSASGTNIVLQVDNSLGYPDVGHITVDDEDFYYSSKTDSFGLFNGVLRAARDTGNGDHPSGSLAHNGEQLRRGVRLGLLLGYQPLVEADYGPGPGYTKMEIQSIISNDSNLTWTLRCSDIQRFTKRKIFEMATPNNPVSIGPTDPITILLRVWTSTGSGENGPYDVLPEENGAAVPVSLIDIDAFEAARGYEGISGTQLQFVETTPQEAKDWGETQILRPFMLLPGINQQGQYTVRPVAVPLSNRVASLCGLLRSN